MEAARGGSVGTVKELIQQGATVNFTDKVFGKELKSSVENGMCLLFRCQSMNNNLIVTKHQEFSPFKLIIYQDICQIIAPQYCICKDRDCSCL